MGDGTRSVNGSVHWWAPLIVVAAAVLLIAALSGPFGGVLLALAGAYLLAPALVVFGVMWWVFRRRALGATAAISILLVGWILALAAAAGIGAMIAGIPFNMRSDLGPSAAWLAFTAPFAVIGAIAGIVFVLRSARRRPVTSDA